MEFCFVIFLKKKKEMIYLNSSRKGRVNKFRVKDREYKIEMKFWGFGNNSIRRF